METIRAAGAAGVARWWKPDVVHVHVFWLAHVATAVREASGVPFVYTVAPAADSR